MAGDLILKTKRPRLGAFLISTSAVKELTEPQQGVGVDGIRGLGPGNEPVLMLDNGTAASLPGNRTTVQLTKNADRRATPTKQDLELIRF